MLAIIVCFSVFITILTGCSNNKTQQEVYNLQNELAEQKNLRCTDKCHDEYLPKCKALHCEDGLGPLEGWSCVPGFNSKDMTCADSVATDNGCNCVCNCGIIANFELAN